LNSAIALSFFVVAVGGGDTVCFVCGGFGCPPVVIVEDC
jgi:hypothetical protein